MGDFVVKAQMVGFSQQPVIDQPDDYGIDREVLPNSGVEHRLDGFAPGEDAPGKQHHDVGVAGLVGQIREVRFRGKGSLRHLSRDEVDLGGNDEKPHGDVERASNLPGTRNDGTAVHGSLT